jgi:uncharacterized protein DUF6600
MQKIVIIAMVILGLSTTQKVRAQTSVGIDFNTFNTALSPYGRWVDNSEYGRVWVCSEPGFRPYYDNGRWEYTDEGWTWVSYYPWGWAPFHYGRWAYTDDYGWVWLPGYDWAPAWVTWSSDDDYYGWAPLGPGMSIDIAIGSIPADRWCFVQHQYINSPSIRSHYEDRSRNAAIYRNATIVNNPHVTNNVHYLAGPKREDVERATHSKIQTRTISNTPKPGRTVLSNNAIHIYRPGVGKTPPSATSARNNRNINGGNNKGRVISRNNTPALNTRTNPVVDHRQHTTQRPVRQPGIRTQPLQQHVPQQQHNMPTEQEPKVRTEQQHIQPQPIREMPQRVEPSIQNNQPRPERNPGGDGGGEHQRRG